MAQTKKDTRYLKKLRLPPDNQKWYCTRKIRYSTKREAKRSLITGRKEGHYKQSHQVYNCPYCFGWHIGRR